MGALLSVLAEVL